MRRDRFVLSTIVLTGIVLMTIMSLSCKASGRNSETHKINKVKFNMNLVPGGNTIDKELSFVTDYIKITKDYLIGETEVTQALWEEVMTDWPAASSTPALGMGDDFPAYGVSWRDAVAFCNALTIAEEGSDTNCVYYSDKELTMVYAMGDATVYTDWTKTGYRLPSEAEWIYAARYIDGTSWNDVNCASGDTSATVDASKKVGQYAWYSGNSEGKSHKVKTRKPNALGIYDMSGNVDEWVYDYYAMLNLDRVQNTKEEPMLDYVRDYPGDLKYSALWNSTDFCVRHYYGGDWDSEGDCGSWYFKTSNDSNKSLGFRLSKSVITDTSEAAE